MTKTKKINTAANSSPASDIWLGSVTIWRVAIVVGTSPAEGCAMREIVGEAVAVFMTGVPRMDVTFEAIDCPRIWAVAGAVGVVAVIVTVCPPASRNFKYFPFS